jgi:hypothetical protein
MGFFYLSPSYRNNSFRIEGYRSKSNISHRLRGYQLPASGPGQPKRNPRAYGRLDDAVEKYEESLSSAATPDAGADELQDRGFAEKKDGMPL